MYHLPPGQWPRSFSSVAWAQKFVAFELEPVTSDTPGSRRTCWEKSPVSPVSTANHFVPSQRAEIVALTASGKVMPQVQAPKAWDPATGPFNAALAAVKGTAGDTGQPAGGG